MRNELAPEDYQRAGERCLENAYRRLYPFDDETLGLEHAVQFPLDGDGRYAVRGVIDRLVRARDGVLEIHDYKTGRRLPSPGRARPRSPARALRDRRARARSHEEGEVRLVWHYLLQNVVRVSTRTPEQLAALRARTCRTIDRIRAEEDVGRAPEQALRLVRVPADLPRVRRRGRRVERRCRRRRARAEWSQLSLF